MVCFSLIAVAAILFSSVNVYGLSSSKSPGDNFDLSNWKLTLPDSSASEISSDDLQDGYEDKYFYTASDGAMAFYVKGNGGTTSGSSYPRSELRQQCNPGQDRYNWFVSSGNYIVSGKYKIGNINVDKIVIQQIHAYDGPPLIKMKWENDKVYALVKTDSSGNNEESYEMGSAPQYEQFLLKTQVKDGYLKLYFNNVRIYNIKVSSYWSDYGNYFKAGNYLQSSSSSDYAYVYIYYLQLSHSGGCTYTSDSFQQEEGKYEDPNNNGTIIAVVVISIALCAFVAFFLCKRKCIPKRFKSEAKEEVKDEEQIDDDEKNTPTGNDGDLSPTAPSVETLNIEIETNA